jgi:hypothetical protein
MKGAAMEILWLLLGGFVVLAVTLKDAFTNKKGGKK